METIDYWRLCDELSVDQAALLIAGGNPSDRSEPLGYEAVKTALTNAIEKRALSVVARFEGYGGTIACDFTTVKVEDLRAWLRARGFKTGFFFPEPEVGPDYLSAFHPHYSAKLAAAVEAWKAV